MEYPEKMGGLDHLKKRPIKFTDGTHMVGIYTVQENILNAVIPFFAEGLKANDRCFYAAAPEIIAKVAGALKKQGIDVEQAVQKDQLVLLNEKAPLLKDGKFDAKYLVDLYRQDIDNALKEGWDHVRATADMSWLIDGDEGREGILYYEALSTELFNDTEKVHALCQYNTALMSGQEIIELLKIHPWALIDNRLGENPFWIDPDPETYRNI